VSVSHAAADAPASTSEQIPGLLAVLSTVPDPRKRRGRRFTLVFVLAVAAVCVLAGAASFREIGDQAADLPQELLAVLGGIPHPLWRRIIVPSEKRFRTLIQALDAEHLDEIIGCWLRRMAGAGRLDHLLTALAIDGKWLRGVPEVKLFAAMLHEEKVVIAQHQIPADTNEITQVKALLDPVDLDGACVTADAAHAQHDTAGYIAGERGADYLLTVKANQPRLQEAIFRKISADCEAAPAYASIDYGHGRIVKRSIWVTSAEGTGFPHAAQVLRIRRDTLRPHRRRAHQGNRARHHQPERRPGHPRHPGPPRPGPVGHRINPLDPRHRLRRRPQHRLHRNGPQVMATVRNLAISLLHLAGVTEIKRTLQRISRDRTRALLVLPL
jgi:DDE_Tnp_1-associated/Transposase DDE domain